MGSKNDFFEGALLGLVFNNIAIANVGDAAGLRASTTAGSLYISLHTADPLDSGADQTANEVTVGDYNSYVRVAVTRAPGAGGWTLTTGGTNSVANTSDITFPACVTGSATITHFGVGLLSSGTGKLLYSGTCTPNVLVSPGITPRILSGGLVMSEA